MKIAVVGAGISGSNILKALISHPNFDSTYEIDVYEYREFLGSGLPYRPTDDRSIMLNTAPDVLSVNLENPNDFEEWLYENYEDPYNFEGLISRPQYGEYLLDRFTSYYTHEQVQHIQSTVEDMEIIEAHEDHQVAESSDTRLTYRLKTKEGWQDNVYDAIFFSVGHPAYNDYYDLKDERNFIHNPYPMNKKLAGFNNQDKIAVIGSGATGIDLMRFFDTNYDLENPLTFYDVKEPFYCVSIPYEKADITYSISMEWIASEKEKHGGYLPLELLLKTIQIDLDQENADVMEVYNRYKAGTLEVYRHAFETKDQELAAIQKYAGKTVLYLPHLYNALSAYDQDKYMKNYHSIMLFFKSKVPYLSYKWLFELVDAGKLEAYAGLEDVEVNDEGTFNITVNGENEQADILVNATGFNSNLEKLSKDMPLIGNLYNKKIIVPHKNKNFVLVDWPECRVMNQKYGVMENVFFLGLLIGGTQHENNDAGQTIEQATYVAKTFMDKQK